MQLWQFVWVLAALTGLTAAGLIGNGWTIVTGQRLGISILSQYSIMTPLRAFALMVYAPLALVRSGLSYAGHNPVFAMMLLAAGLLWSFLQGVFILCAFFGFT